MLILDDNKELFQDLEDNLYKFLNLGYDKEGVNKYCRYLLYKIKVFHKGCTYKCIVKEYLEIDFKDLVLTKVI